MGYGALGRDSGRLRTKMRLSATEKKRLRERILSLGAVAAGFAAAREVSESFKQDFLEWQRKGMAGDLGYMQANTDLRFNPDKLLPGARTVISMAFSYNQPDLRDTSLPMLSKYAWGRDYHKTIRSLTKPLLNELKDRYGAENRLCVDSAPIPERYWAMRAGIGRRARNGSIIIDRAGSFVFLAEILTTLDIEPDSPSVKTCLDCGLCIRACPSGAITPHGIDASRCLAALTIEKSGAWDPAQKVIMRLPGADFTLFGCDRCQQCCPHNAGIPTTVIADFKPRPQIVRLTADDLQDMDEEEFLKRFAGTPLIRTGLAGLQRNARNIKRGPASD